MFGTLFQSSDVVSTSFGVATVATLATAVLALLGLSWVADRWRVPVALSGVALLASGLHYLDAAQIWFSTQQMTSAPRYVGWFVVQPIQVASVFFLARIAGPVPVGVFWRTVAAAILMVLCRYLGDAGIFNPTLGVLLSIAFWLYILGELYFGPMSEAVRKSSRPIRLGYFWIRLILTIGWAIYPILFFVDVVIGAGHARSVIVLYTLADLVNLITVSMIVLAAAGKERF
ncbi:bacteriorhodopsin [Rhodoligotrophos defluvii]|uniref:bacteriorhodopsin n=1 Tax=Rhodoligotrophos defluvii TaxID=2561934 RepID=UPI0014851145|nr:bacteriorhodopsin [Rhodoligotrophos defluvii]